MDVLRIDGWTMTLSCQTSLADALCRRPLRITNPACLMLCVWNSDAGLSENYVFCLWFCYQKPRNKNKTWLPFGGFFPALFGLKIIKICAKNCKIGRSGRVQGALGKASGAYQEAFGSPKFNKPKQSDLEDIPQGPSLGTKIWKKTLLSNMFVVF